MSDVILGAIIGVAGAVFGGIFTSVIGPFIQCRVQDRYNSSNYKKARMQEAYELVEQTVLKICDPGTPGEELIRTIENMRVKLSLYGGPEVRFLFSDISKLLVKREKTDAEFAKIYELNGLLVKFMRIDLGINDEKVLCEKSPFMTVPVSHSEEPTADKDN